MSGGSNRFLCPIVVWQDAKLTFCPTNFSVRRASGTDRAAARAKFLPATKFPRRHKVRSARARGAGFPDRTLQIPYTAPDVLDCPDTGPSLHSRAGKHEFDIGSGMPALNLSASWCLSCDMPLDASFFFGSAIFDSARISFGQRAPEGGGFQIPAIRRRSGLLPPGVVQITAVDRVEAKIIDKAKHCGLGVQRIAGDRKSNPPRRSPRNALLEKALGEDVVECLDYGTPELLRDPLAPALPASIRPVAADMGVVRIGTAFPGFDERLQAHQIDRPLGAAVVHEFHRLLPILVLEEDDGVVA